MSQSYKTLKEDFVSNLSGGSVSEINLVTAVAPVGELTSHTSAKADRRVTGRLSAMGDPSVAPWLLQ